MLEVGSRPPVLLLHGLGGDETHMAFIAAYLEAIGHPFIFPVYDTRANDIEGTARDVFEQIKNKLSFWGSETFHAITHSMGLLTLVELNKAYGGLELPYPEKTVAMTPPWKGSRLAAFFSRAEAFPLVPKMDKPVHELRPSHRRIVAPEEKPIPGDILVIAGQRRGRGLRKNLELGLSGQWDKAVIHSVRAASSWPLMLRHKNDGVVRLDDTDVPGAQKTVVNLCHSEVPKNPEALCHALQFLGIEIDFDLLYPNEPAHMEKTELAYA